MQRLSDDEIARLVKYLTQRFGSGDHHVTGAQVGAMRPSSPTPPPAASSSTDHAAALEHT
ncbi:hypothetical protein JK182_00760 [Acetobacter okinawensis]|uniref:hypothetical protein n=1 Tax=Acetobacter okinawensis TaxID=1076594 RepID=UPI001BAAED13|nr:hypothetical protein [Acetobacter okinawensis]MBS0987222.1 hypothetical protein [Acetobacter okinawensis]